ncbi:unnamed protein product [Litomosoides sigmodontis]|uniref:MSP domain-containing protein n=1 Tax=Litomosoides sigmodontis TaxID=42156 RepID=A0A3P6SRL4_LITSI|nr:unnamed protein product [Litomosoides sigmodontis]
MLDGSDSSGSSESKTVGDTPDFEVYSDLFEVRGLHKIPKNLVQIRNNDPVPIVYRIRTRERSFPRFSTCHGFLQPNEEDEVCVLIPSSDYWPRDPAEYAGRRHKVVVENLTVPVDAGKPKDKNEASAISAMIFKATPPLTRMYTKLSILLPKIIDNKSTERSTET